MLNANRDLFTKEEDGKETTGDKLANNALKRITGQKVEGEVSYLPISIAPFY